MYKESDKELNPDKGIVTTEENTGERYYFTDVIRKKWDAVSLQSVAGSRLIKLIQSCILFVSIHAVCEYGMQFNDSLIHAAYMAIGGNPAVFLGVQAGLALLWMLTPNLVMFLFIIGIFASLGGLSPLLIAIACAMLFTATTDDRTVQVAAIAMPAMIICLTDKQWIKLFGESYESHFMTQMILMTSLGIFITVFAAYVSTKYNNGFFAVLSFPAFSIFAVTLKMFGKIEDAGGKSVVSYKKDYWPLLVDSVDEAGNRISVFNPDIMNDFREYLMQPMIRVLILFLVISVVFVILLKLNNKQHNLHLDVRDGIAFAAAAALLCLSIPLLNNVAGLTDCRYTIPEILLQVAAAYVVTRPVAGRMMLKPNLQSQKNGFIFISYAHKDFERIKPYLSMLTKERYEYWYDNGIRTGDEWQGVIASNLANCDCLLAFVSENSIYSEYCIKEINYATSKHKPMAVIMLDDVPMPPVLEMHLASLQAIQRFNLSNDRECMDKILELDQLKRCKL